ncbi:prolactin-7B1-like [Nannospalax galili]|uniref:prolactin-7B1-like n=1 Tax=Nannospalax galili TaxID=1026970 RepID=UPI000819E307|nr:prolactin-7B1-like [Nannospalax galili]
MQLTLTQPRSWTFLLLFVPSFLLWENVHSASTHDTVGGLRSMNLKELLDMAMLFSGNIGHLNKQLRKLYFNNVFSAGIFSTIMLNFKKNPEFRGNAIRSCQKFSQETPGNIEEAKRIAVEDFLKIIVRPLRFWNDTLHHLVSELSIMPEVPTEILSKVEDIKTRNEDLLELIRWIINKVFPGVEENEMLPVNQDLVHFQTADQNARIATLHKFNFCLGIDTNSIGLYLKLMKCVLTGGKKCHSIGF